MRPAAARRRRTEADSRKMPKSVLWSLKSLTNKPEPSQARVTVAADDQVVVHTYPEKFRGGY
ncbi:hypothetical protein SS37A_14360 [Methylocystis iwaonis]|uniref:Uncharacterized protein n=1 Tax=Methylocystis iwaonis TaxID=2885079 RepID=A0ABN6VG41_9HYPH|nr:hypothetical protein SS37A_14360 [Methylocystis iwaonis]